jgi:hypothetical protein
MLGASTASAVVIRSQVESFGSDGTAASNFSNVSALAFKQSARELFAADRNVPGIYGFNVSSPPAHLPLSAFSPLATVGGGSIPGIAVDNTALPSAGNVYLASEATGMVYGFDASGAPLGGNFPIDPAISPGGPSGSPKDICGAAVDSVGNLWIANYTTQSILEYDSSGVFQKSISTAAQGFYPCYVAFDSNDDMYVTNGGDSTRSTYKYTAAGGYASGTLFDAHSGRGNAVDRTNHHVFLIDTNVGAVNEYDSLGNLLSTTSGQDATGHLIIPTSSGIPGAAFRGVTVDAANNRVYVADESQSKIRVFGDAQTYPDLTLGTSSGVSNTMATVEGAISSQGVTLSNCHFEFISENVFRAGGFSDLSSGGSVPCSPASGSIPVDSATHPVSAALSGLTANTSYRFRLVAANANGSITTSDAGFTTTGPPIVETMGSPVRTTTTARLDGRVDPSRAAASYRFEYGDQGPCNANPCVSAEPHAAGSGNEFEFVSQHVEGLQPNTTYHYRVIADNGNPDGPATGEDMTLTTFADEAPLSHGHLPGPPGSDRAWELVSAPDAGGNPVGTGLAPGASAISDAGDRAIYGVAGGTPLSETGTLATRLFAERTPAGWQTKNIYASREEATGSGWGDPGGPSDLTEMIVENDAGSGTGPFSIWRLTPGGSPAKIYTGETPSKGGQGVLLVSDDSSRTLISLTGPQDPVHSVEAGKSGLYDVDSGSPQMVSLLPDGTVPACGVTQSTNAGPGIPSGVGVSRSMHWISANGSLAYFPSRGNSCDGPLRLYVRDLDAETTKLISTPPISGPECDAHFIKSIPGAAYFFTQNRLVNEDVEPQSCVKDGSVSTTGGDVYRYNFGDDTLDCVTCVIPGGEAGVYYTNNANTISGQIGIAEDGSRIYFTSRRGLLPGAAAAEGVYRLAVASGNLAYVGSFDALGDYGNSTMNPDGSVAVFQSDDPSLNAIGGQQNGGGEQFYRYDDRDRSLICVSCPVDGSVPTGPVTGKVRASRYGLGANQGSLSADGEDVIFATPTPLAPADQNTAGAGQKPEVGTDVYEWRAGRTLLISDGLINWPAGGNAPEVSGITPSGHDIFFTAAAQYTPDALDGYKRLYDARIGGGFEFPRPPKPCPLEVCQGTPQGAPEEQAPGTATITGVGNLQAKAKKHHKRRHKKHAKKGQHKANNKRRAAR